jgi:hypothetical protein
MAVGGQATVADGVNAGMHEVQAPVGRPALDSTWSEADSAKLPQRDHSMLPLGKLGNSSIEGDLEGTWAGFGLTMRLNPAHVVHGPKVEGQMRAGDARFATELPHACPCKRLGARPCVKV